MRRGWRWLVTVVVVNALHAGGARAAYDPVFEDGYECRTWYVDADADGYGATGSGVFSCIAPAGHVPRADDCDDSNPTVNPRAPDRPDASYLDANCDGFDGDAERAIHVAIGGTDSLTCGGRAAPCATVVYAIGRRTTIRPDVYIRQGAYPGAVIIPPLPGVVDSGVFGGFDSQWVRMPGVISRIDGGVLATLDGGSGGLFVDAATVVLGDLEIVAPNAAGTSAGSGRASVGLVARNANVTAWGCRIAAGRGSNGGTGNPGVPAAGTAANGGIGGNAVARASCNVTPGGSVGLGASNACPAGGATAGGNGGRGGAADGDCGTIPNPLGQPGSRGGDAAVIAGIFGLGGAGGSGAVSCGPANAGSPGFPGSAGSGGSGGTGGILVSGNWVGLSGQAGGAGGDGGGGGGGGGSGGCDIGGNTAGAGGGGGGAGGCAALQGGAGGRGGGASIAVLLTAVAANITTSTLATAGGGNGGNGGAGASGQAGGPGGPGGDAVNGTATGAAGGAGGAGGASGGGGGGAGGPSYGILRSGGSLSTGALIFQLGAGGSGGAGGAAAAGGNAGQPGGTGVSVAIPPG